MKPAPPVMTVLKASSPDLDTQRIPTGTVWDRFDSTRRGLVLATPLATRRVSLRSPTPPKPPPEPDSDPGRRGISHDPGLLDRVVLLVPEQAREIVAKRAKFRPITPIPHLEHHEETGQQIVGVHEEGRLGEMRAKLTT